MKELDFSDKACIKRLATFSYYDDAEDFSHIENVDGGHLIINMLNKHGDEINIKFTAN